MAAIKFSPHEILEETDGVKSLRVCADLIGYGPGDVTVRPVDKQLLLLDKANEVLTSCELPESVDPFSVEASVSVSGVLVILAPLMC